MRYEFASMYPEDRERMLFNIIRKWEREDKAARLRGIRLFPKGCDISGSPRARKEWCFDISSFKKIKTNTPPLPKYSLLRTFSLGYNISTSSPNCLRATGRQTVPWRLEVQAAQGLSRGQSCLRDSTEEVSTGEARREEICCVSMDSEYLHPGNEGEKGVWTLKGKNVEEQMETPVVWTQLGHASQSSKTNPNWQQQCHPSCRRTQQMPTGLPLPAAEPAAGCSAAPAMDRLTSILHARLGHDERVAKH